MKTSSTGIVAPALPRARLRTDSKPWHRQFWPWFLIALPAISVVFSFATLYIAVSGADEVIPHEGDSSSFSAPEQPERGTVEATSQVQVHAEEVDVRAELHGTAKLRGDAAAAPGDLDHGVP